MDVSCAYWTEANSSPECLGLPCASLYLLLMMLFIPFPFSHIFQVAGNNGVGREKFPTGEVR